MSKQGSIKTWQERIHVDIVAGNLTTENRMSVKSSYMAAEIAELRSALTVKETSVAEELRSTLNELVNTQRRLIDANAELAALRLHDTSLPVPVAQVRSDVERASLIWLGKMPPPGTLLYTVPSQLDNEVDDE